jgi:beta-glucosidase
VQEHLLETITALGKPTVLVLQSGSALAVNWAQAHVPAIVEAWYGGQAAGTAIADVLFGNYSPAGRLPVTFYKDTSDIPAFDDYKMAGRTYRFFKGAPLFPFGHGLSLTTFAYSRLRTSAPGMRAKDTVTVSVNVTNTGKRAGDEVVQLYVAYPSSKVERPIKDLRGFKRVTLVSGQTRTVSFKLPASSLAYWDTGSHAWVVEPGVVELQVGASSADIRVRRQITVNEAGITP